MGFRWSKNIQNLKEEGLPKGLASVVYELPIQENEGEQRMVVPFESANYFTEVGKVKMKIYRNGEIEIIDPFPKPYAFAPSKNEIQTQAKMERTDFKAFDTGEAVKRYTFNVPQQVKFFRNFQEAKSISVYEADKKYVGVWMLDNNLVCSDYENVASWDTV